MEIQLEEEIYVKEQPKEIRKFCVIDTETGGLTPEYAILSVAAVIIDQDFNVLEKKYGYVRDYEDKLVDPDALIVNNLSLTIAREKGVPIEKIVKDLQTITNECVVVCHNAAFDMKMLNSRGLNVEKAVDTMLLSWWMWPSQTAKLGMVAKRMGFDENFFGLHNALGDALLTVEVLKFFSENIKTFDPLIPTDIIWDLDYKMAYRGFGLPYRGFGLSNS